MRKAMTIPVKPMLRAIEGMTDAELGRAFSALMAWYFNGTETAFPDPVKEHYKQMQYCILHPRRGWKDPGAMAARQIRNSAEYAEWRLSVYKRDGFRCQACGRVGGVIHAHHIKHFATHPEYRLDLNNGITLCKECHKAVHRGERKCRTE